MSASLYDKYGGFSAISRVVMAFYDMVLDSDVLGPYFDGIDMPRLIDHQTKFVASILGGPAAFTDERLEQAHRGLGIRETDFDEMKRLLGLTLDEHGFSVADRTAVLAEIESRRSIIVQTQ